MLKNELAKQGAKFYKSANFTDHVEIDGNLITSQNPQSTQSLTKEMVKLIKLID